MAPERLDPINEAHRQWVAHGWAPAAPGMAAVTTVVRVNQVLMARIERLLRPFDLTFARFEVLRLLAFTSAGCLPMGRMGALLQVHPTSITNAVDRLEAQGLLERRPHPTDGRSTLAGILPAGRRTAANQAAYDEGHLRRLHLVRVLTDIQAIPESAIPEKLFDEGRARLLIGATTTMTEIARIPVGQTPKRNHTAVLPRRSE